MLVSLSTNDRGPVRHRPAPEGLLPLWRKRHCHGVAVQHGVEVRLLEHVLGPDLTGAELALTDPAADRLRVPAGTPGGFRDGQHRCCILQHGPAMSNRTVTSTRTALPASPPAARAPSP